MFFVLVFRGLKCQHLSDMRLDLIINALRVLADGQGAQYWSASESARELVGSSSGWLPSEKPAVQRALQLLMTGTLDAVGAPQIRLPAEFVAAAIGLVVDPRNQQVACSWYAEIVTGKPTTR